MAKIRTKKLEKQGLTRERYFELLYFSRQYIKIKQRGPGDPLAWRVLVIEEAARAAREDIFPYLLENVTTGRTFEQTNPPCGRSQFFAARRQYFIELDRLCRAR
jgi:hypothetical protein